jgi:hypothetical protein
MLIFTTGRYNWAKIIIRTVLRGVLGAVVGRFVHTALVIAERGIETTWICEPES